MARLMAGGALGDSRTAQSKSRAGLFAAGAAALNLGLTYYGQVSNLDVPYLFWGMLGLLWTMRAVVERQPRHFWAAALFAAASIATKDQAYALFLLSLPLFLLAWFVLDSWPRLHAGKIAGLLLPAAAVALLLLLLVDGAITNGAGFSRRIAFLAGPASGDYAEYLKGPSGWLALLGDMGRYFGKGYGIVAVALAVSGFVLHVGRTRDGVRVAGLLPALAIVSFTLCFNFATLRSDDRFLLPQAVLACVYIGIAAEALAFAPRARLAGRAALAVTALFALHQMIAIDAAFLFDPRYDAETWMQAHVRPGDRIETYGQNAYLPRFPQQALVTRIGDKPLNLRNPLPGVVERKEPFGAVKNRDPRFIVVSEWWVRHYRIAQESLPPGRSYPPNQMRQFADLAARRYFASLYDGSLGYRLVHTAGPVSRFWPEIHIHESLNETIQIFERVP
jgi:hypothetical protein